MQITPAPNRSGTATIGIIVTDDTGNSVVTQFLLTVLATTGSGGSTPVVSGFARCDARSKCDGNKSCPS